jgi:DNA-directed RNA polymerase I, II, and III subunit RPABC2
MPPKKSKKVKPTEVLSDASPNNSKKTEEMVESDNEEDMPALELTNTTRERFEYKPLLHTEIVFKNPKDRITSEVMTRFELCEVMSIRAKQLETGRKIFTDVGNMTDPLEIAKKEILDKRCPLSIVRMLTDKVAEKWHVNEMAIPYDAF